MFEGSRARRLEGLRVRGLAQGLEELRIRECEGSRSRGFEESHARGLEGLRV